MHIRKSCGALQTSDIDGPLRAYIKEIVNVYINLSLTVPAVTLETISLVYAQSFQKTFQTGHCQMDQRDRKIQQMWKTNIP